MARGVYAPPPARPREIVRLYDACRAPYHFRVRRYQWLLFDADGTLFDYEAAERLALGEAFRRIGAKCEPSHLAAYRRINQALWEGVERGELSPSEVKVRRFELFMDEMRLEGSPEHFSALYLECLADCPELLPEVEALLGELHGRYRMAILTNGLQAVQRRRLSRSPIHWHFEDIVISEEIGFAKPAREFFDVALERLGIRSREEALMIGDGWVSDITGANESGIDACWFNPGRKPRPASPGIAREIVSLKELADWLGG